MSGSINEDVILDTQRKIDKLVGAITYFLTEDGYSESTSLFYSPPAPNTPKVSFNSKWPVPLIFGFTDKLEYSCLLEDVTENRESLTKFFNKQRVLNQQYQLLNLLSGD